SNPLVVLDLHGNLLGVFRLAGNPLGGGAGYASNVNPQREPLHAVLPPRMCNSTHCAHRGAAVVARVRAACAAMLLADGSHARTGHRSAAALPHPPERR